jgi:hypothetical protein
MILNPTSREDNELYQVCKWLHARWFFELWQVTAGTLDDILVTDSLRRPKRTQKKLFAEGEKAMYDQIQEDNKTKWYARMV